MKYSIDPPVDGVSVDPETGEVTLDASVLVDPSEVRVWWSDYRDGEFHPVRQIAEFTYCVREPVASFVDDAFARDDEEENPYLPAPEGEFPILDKLHENEVFYIDRRKDGGFQFTEDCDRYYTVALTRAEVLALADELRRFVGDGE